MKKHLLIVQITWLLLIASCTAPPSTPNLVTEIDLPNPTAPNIQKTDIPQPQPTQERIDTETPVVVPPTPTAQFQVTHDVLYATSLQPEATAWNLDIYSPNGAKDSPVVVFAHGFKAVKEGHKRESQVLTENGAVVYTITWPTWILDLAEKENGQGYREMSEVLTCAIRFARTTAPEYGGDPNRLTLVGFSMGAVQGSWIAIAGESLGSQWEAFANEQGGPAQQVECEEDRVSDNVDIFVGIGGPYYLLESLEERNEALWKIASPLAHLGENPNLAIRLFHGEQDNYVDPESSILFNDALTEAGYDSEVILYDGGHLVPADLITEVIIGLVGN